MPKFSDKSWKRLEGCHPDLRKVFNAVILDFDCMIITGERTNLEQAELFRKGLSKLQFPKSKHNSSPSLAVDVAPYPIDWKDRERFNYFAGFVKGIALGFGITLRWGGDWDSDWQVRDNVFDDLLHFELVGDY